MGTLLASRIKSRRKELKLSQKELAEGICKQGQISRLENGEYVPGSELLHSLAKKMNVSMDYFFDETISSESAELSDFKKLAKNFIAQRDYESLKYIYELEKVKIHRLSLSDKIYMEWVGSLIDFYFYDKKQKAIENIEKILQSIDKKDLNYLQLSNTLFNFYYETENMDRFKFIQSDLIEKVEQLTVVTIEELELVIKFNYNLGRYLWLNKDIEKAIKKLVATIELCKEYRTTYLLADLFLILGNISINFSDRSIVKEYFETAHFLFSKIERNVEMALIVEHYIAENF